MCDGDKRVRSLASVAYVCSGVLVASQHDCYAHLITVSQVVSASVATAPWPLILFGASLHLKPRPAVGERCDASTAARQGPHHVHGSSRSAQFWG
jgi:hypothetical protein